MPIRQREDLAARTALLYYQYQRSQNEIAVELGISRSYVSQLLTYARGIGMVKISINIDGDYLKETEFAARFPGLRHAYIMRSDSDEYTAANIGSFAAPHVTRLINAAQAIGINLSKAVQSVIECLDSTDFPVSGSRTVVQIMGGFGNNQQPDTMLPGELVAQLAKKIGARSLYLNCPAIIENPGLKASLMQEHSIATIAAFWQTLDLTIMGIGVANESSRIYSQLAPEMREILKDKRVCSEITVNFFDEEGHYQPLLDDYKISIPYEELQAVKTKVVTGHGANKARAILAGLRADMIDVLLTDSITIAQIEALLVTDRS